MEMLIIWDRIEGNMAKLDVVEGACEKDKKGVSNKEPSTDMLDSVWIEGVKMTVALVNTGIISEKVDDELGKISSVEVTLLVSVCVLKESVKGVDDVSIDTSATLWRVVRVVRVVRVEVKVLDWTTAEVGLIARDEVASTGDQFDLSSV